MDKIQVATEKFAALIRSQLERVERMKAEKDFLDYDKLDTIVIGVVGGDGIGPAITHEAHRIMEYLLEDISFNAGGDYPMFTLHIDRKYVDEHLRKLTGDRNLKKYVL